MRVTQSMLSSNMLRNLNNSYGKMSKLQSQIYSGSKITRPSDDPVIAVKGMGYRRDLEKVEQYTRNMGEVNSWLDASDESLNQVGEQLKRVRELVIQASNDTNTLENRQLIKMEIDQIRQQIQDVGNTKIADRHIFSGTNTDQPLFTPAAGGGKEINPAIIAPEGSVKIEVYDGIQIQVNTPGKDLFKDLDEMMAGISNLLDGKNKDGSTPTTPITGADIGNLLGGVSSTSTGDDITALHNKVLEAQADIGARQNRAEMMENRLGMQKISVTKQLADNESVDYAEAITEMVEQESVHQASLSVGAKIIQQTLVDFIR